MKKAFDQNVSRSKPRLRLGGVGAEGGELGEETPEAVLAGLTESSAPAPTAQEALSVEVQARARKARKPTAIFQEALRVEAPRPEAVRVVVPPVRGDRGRIAAPVAAPPAVAAELAPPEVRRERLKERLKAVRENPRPEPLPSTSAEAGMLAVERIATLQTELGQMKALNLALTQDLEAARRQAERATEEARLRIDEARRLAEQMEGRVKLLNDLERELASLEGERDESLLSLQEARGALESAAQEADRLRHDILTRDQSLADSLAEEERLAVELEREHESSRGFQRALEALTTERDTLARQVSDLTNERAELLEARKALESVHRALSQAVSR